MGKGSGRRPAQIPNDVYADNHARIFPPKVKKERCERCGWPLAPTLEEGCVPGNCSLRGEK